MAYKVFIRALCINDLQVICSCRIIVLFLSNHHQPLAADISAASCADVMDLQVICSILSCLLVASDVPSAASTFRRCSILCCLLVATRISHERAYDRELCKER